MDIKKAEQINKHMSQFTKGFLRVKSKFIELQEKKSELFVGILNKQEKKEEYINELDKTLKLERRYIRMVTGKFDEFHKHMKESEDFVKSLDEKELKQLDPRENFYRIFKEFWDRSMKMYDKISGIFDSIQERIKKEDKLAERVKILHNPKDLRKLFKEWNKEISTEKQANYLHKDLYKLIDIKNKFDKNYNILKHMKFEKKDGPLLLIFIAGTVTAGFGVIGALVTTIVGMGMFKYIDANANRRQRKDVMRL